LVMCSKNQSRDNVHPCVPENPACRKYFTV
jgi:hypothetical protein